MTTQLQLVIIIIIIIIIKLLSAVDVTSCGLVEICEKLVRNFEMSVISNQNHRTSHSRRIFWEVKNTRADQQYTAEVCCVLCLFILACVHSLSVYRVRRALHNVGQCADRHCIQAQ